MRPEEVDQDEPWKDEEVMRELRTRKGLTYQEIAKRLGTTQATACRWARRLGVPSPLPYNHDKNGYEYIYPGDRMIYIHRMLAIAEYGFEAVFPPDGRRTEVHHKNGIPWDNRPKNLELLDASEHQSKHRLIDEETEKVIAETYEITDLSSREVADLMDVSSGTVLRYHKRRYGDA